MAKKSSALRIRVEEDLHQQFLAACHDDDRPAAQVLREFMRKFVAERDDLRQQPLFQDETRSV